MKNEKFEQAKQAVAEGCGYKDWATLQWYRHSIDKYLEDLYAEAAELYADSRSRKAANEAVKADRETIRKECVESCWLKEPGWDSGDEFLVLDEVKFESLPLPFPEESL